MKTHPPDATGEPDSGPDETGDEAIRQALGVLGMVWSQVEHSVKSAYSDPEIRRHLRDAASSLGEALSAAMEHLADGADEEE